MASKPRNEWTAIEIASRAMNATSLSEMTLPEVKKLAARVLREEAVHQLRNLVDGESQATVEDLLDRVRARGLNR